MWMAAPSKLYGSESMGSESGVLGPDFFNRPGTYGLESLSESLSFLQYTTDVTSLRDFTISIALGMALNSS